MPRQNWFTEAFGEAIADIRQKLVEQPWFGRTVTPPHDQAARTMTDELCVRPDDQSTEHDVHSHEHGHDLEP